MDARSAVVPDLWLEKCIDAHRRLEILIAGLTDEQTRRPTLLPGWTVGHLLTHLARNADSHTGMMLAAQQGTAIAQYPGGPIQREGDIEAGHARSAAELVSDGRASHQRLEDAWATTSPAIWETGLGLRKELSTIAYCVFLRWREVTVHLVDLDLPSSPSWEHLDPAYFDAEWPALLSGLGRRLPAGTAVVLVPGDRPSHAAGQGDTIVTIRATPAAIMQWLLGRGGDAGWPPLGPWT